MHELFRRYTQDEANEREKQVIEFWGAEKDAAGLTDKDKLSADHSPDLIWQSISEQLQLPGHSDNKNRRSTRKVRLIPALRYAAVVLFIAMLAGITYYQIQPRHGNQPAIVYQAGDRIREEYLPDGTRVFINQNSQLTVASGFNRDKREVWLDGEAFFEVAKNPEKPFAIHHAQLRTVVKGTLFNIKAYREIGENVVSVRSGKVEVHGTDKLLGTLTANQQLIYSNRDGKYETEQLDWEDAAGWINGEMILNYANATELRLRLMQYFGVDLKVQGDLLAGIRIRSVFIKEASLDDVMMSICSLYKLKYKREDNQVILYR